MDSKVCIWPDGTWCLLSEVEEYSWMSDDYRIVRVTEWDEDGSPADHYFQ